MAPIAFDEIKHIDRSCEVEDVPCDGNEKRSDPVELVEVAVNVSYGHVESFKLMIQIFLGFLQRHGVSDESKLSK